MLRDDGRAVRNDDGMVQKDDENEGENMYIIVGLGNPGRQYDATRHNIGFEVVDKISIDHDVKIKAMKLDAYGGEGFIAGQKIVLIKPTTYMNLSGTAVRAALKYYKMPKEDVAAKLIVVYDDTDLPVGKIRIRERGTAGGHNGIKNILYHLETEDFVRVRIGVGKRPQERAQADHVLSRFTKEEMDDAVGGVLTAAKALEDVVAHGVAYAMNKYNGEGMDRPIG